MSDLNDENTRRLVRAGADAIDCLLSHFHDDAATFESFSKITPYLVRLNLILSGLSTCIQNEVQERTHVITDTAA